MGSSQASNIAWIGNRGSLDERPTIMKRRDLSLICAGTLALTMLAAAPYAGGAEGTGPEPERGAGGDPPRGGINSAGLWEWIGPPRRSPTIKYINPEVPPIEVPAYPGARYEAVVPDTLDLAERAAPAVHGLTAPSHNTASDPLWLTLGLSDFISSAVGYKERTMPMYHALLGIEFTAVGLTAARAADLSLTATPYGTGGLFTSPLIPAEGDTVTVTVRAQVEGEIADPVEAELVIRSTERGIAHSERLKLTIEGSRATGSLKWTPPRNGPYMLRAVVNPDGRIAENERGNNEATLELPVVVPGRRPYFPWFAERDYLRWANLWGGGIDKEHLGRWIERGVRPLNWKWGTNLPGKPTEEDFYKLYGEADECPGIAIDECGYYPTPETMEKFAVCLRGLARAKQERPHRFVLMWHCGSFYPEQAARYRTACDLVVLESYVFYHAPHGLGTENIYDFLDMKMFPARQVDLLGPTGPQVITSIDLDPKYFNRGELENVICHLRRRWPEMRGFGIYGELTPRDLPEEQRAGAVADEQFVDRLCYEYFVAPVLTFLPGSLWVGRARDGSLQVEAAVSNIGGMDSGPVRAGLYVDGLLLKEFSIAKVPAGNSRLDNRVLLSTPWSPQPGRHELRARIEGAKGCTLLDQEIQVIRAFSPEPAESRGSAP